MTEIIGMIILTFVTFTFATWLLKELYEHDHGIKKWDNERY